MTAYITNIPAALAVTGVAPKTPLASTAARALDGTPTQSVRESAGHLQDERATLLDLLRNLVHGDVGRSTLQKLSEGQGTETDDGKTWLAAKAFLANKRPPAAAPRAIPGATLPATDPNSQPGKSHD